MQPASPKPRLRSKHIKRPRSHKRHESIRPPQTTATPSQRQAALSGLGTPAAPSIVLPGSSLFIIQPDSAARFVVETDPRFANYRQWLSVNAG